MLCQIVKQSLCGQIRQIPFVVSKAALLLLFVWSASIAQALDVLINSRPLTPQEITDYGLTNTTQLASGLPNVGIGQPAYLEAFVEKDAVVISVLWELITKPAGSQAVLQESPLAGLPTSDYGDVLAYDVAGQKMLVPDVLGQDPALDYKVGLTITAATTSKGVTTTNTVSVTKTFFGSKFNGMYPDLSATGNSGFSCLMCHPTKVDSFAQTPHASAFTRKINGSAGAGFKSTCASCHVVGYDAAPDAVNGGFDDVMQLTGWTWPTNLGDPVAAAGNWDAMPPSLQNKSNIQCESCHGPGFRHMIGGGSTAMEGRGIGISLSSANCGVCHDKMSHHVKNFEWKQTGHAVGYVFRTGSCAPCHTGKGFIDAHDPGEGEPPWSGTVETRGTNNEGISCAACHDPHNKTGEGQLRVVDSVTFANGFSSTDGGEGLLCMQCHQDRYDANDQWKGWSSRSDTPNSPHHGVQGDFLFGQNAIEYDQDMPSSRHWDVVEDTCVSCHMQEGPEAEGYGAPPLPGQNHVGGHTFRIGWTDGTNTIHLTEGCLKCHGEIENFNFGGEDYDQDGVVEGVQKEIKDMMFDLAKLLPPYTGLTIDTTGWPSGYAEDESRRKARYNYLLVQDDGSLGVHNPKYTAAILRASIDDLKGGIDVDRDGLPDQWEIDTFGSITAQSGSDDYDGDGLTNAQEKALGTNPKLKDSDYDGVWDGAELQAGTDPTNGDSAPGTNMVSFLPAFELGYFPSEMGVNVQFQSIDLLELQPGGWVNIGESFVTSNAWFYQLISPRDAERKFFRVATPVAP